MGEHRVVTEHQEGEDRPIMGEEQLSWGSPLDSHHISIVKEKHTVWITASGVKASCLGKANENMHISCLALSVFMVFSSKSLPCFVVAVTPPGLQRTMAVNRFLRKGPKMPVSCQGVGGSDSCHWLAKPLV